LQINYLVNRYIEKIAAEFAPGILDPLDYGDISELPRGELVNWVIHEHDARKAGKHYDIRFGKDKLFSFATRKELPRPGEKKQIALYPQPLHEGSYAEFEGEIPEGYGAGTVKKLDRGEILVTQVTPTNIQFVLAHKKRPEMFNLVKIMNKKQRRPVWLMRNITPTESHEFKKLHYTMLPAEQIDKLMDDDYIMSAKIDGAAGFAKLMKDHVDVLSIRNRTTGEPIIHTPRMGLTDKIEIPKHLIGKVYRGEIYGMRGERALPIQELGGLLNSSLVKSLRKQESTGTKLRMALFGVPEGGLDISSKPILEQRKEIQEALKYLPADVFGEPPYAESKREKKKLWNLIKSKKYPLTTEGVVGFPVGGGNPLKIKLLKEYDVYVRKIFSGVGKYSGKAAGGFEYSYEPNGKIIGRIGSGISDELRRDMYENPEDYIGRIAVVRAYEKFPSGALRNPVLHMIHEDY
jgi:hypothetical protein